MKDELNQRYEHRTERLKQYIESTGKTQADFAAKIGKKSSYLSQLFSGIRPFTEKMAREIEEKADLPSGWLDQVGTQIPRPNAKEQTILAEVKDLDDDDQTKVLLYVRELLIAKYRTRGGDPKE